MKTRITLIDDDLGPMDYYVEALRHRGYLVAHLASGKDVREFLDQSSDEPPTDLLIQDMMMPPGGIYPRSKRIDELLTGIHIANDARRKWPELPIILLSSCSFPREVESGQTFSKGLEDCVYLAKFETSPFELADLVTRFFSTGKLRKSFFSRLRKAVQLEPNFSGIGINLKELD